MSVSVWVVFDPDTERTLSTQEQVYTGVVVDAGPVGPTGPPGPAGDSSYAGYTWVQAVPSDDWVVSHPLGYFPAGVLVIDSGGTTIEGDVSYPDVATVRIQFAAPFGGTAYLS